MDPSRFDTLAKSITTTASRRSVLAGLVAGLLAPLLAQDDLSAKKGKGKGKKKKKGTAGPPPGGGGCVANCAGKAACADDDCGAPCETCGGGQTCGGGGTPGVCGGGGTCTPNCYNPNGPSRICGPDGCGGGCGFNEGNCYQNQVCTGDGIYCSCPGDTPTQCSDGCVDTMTDVRNCGICGRGCSPGLNCCNGACAGLSGDPFNCGTCGKVCDTPPRTTCCQGTCEDYNNGNGLCWPQA